MQLTKRQKDIIFSMLEKNSFVTVHELSKEFNVSGRTIRKDFQIIDFYLKQNGFMAMERLPNKGCRIKTDEAATEQLKNKLFMLSDRNLSQRERILIASTLLIIKGKTTTTEIAKLCFVDQQTILKDMKPFEEMLLQNDLYLIKKAGVGLRLIGDEDKIRHYFFEIAKQDATIRLFIFNSIPVTFLDTATTIIKHVESSLSLNYIDFALLHLNIAYILLRINSGQSISDSFCTNELEILENTPEYKILNTLDEVKFFSQKERIFIARVLMEFKVSVSDFEQSFNDYFEGIDHDVDRISEYILNELKKALHIDEETQGEFIKGLWLHLRVSIFRIKNNIEIQNDLLEQIKLTIPLIYEFTKKKLIECEKRYGLYFNENEIAFIAIHVAVVYEKSIKLNLPTLLIICSFGIATSKILAARMKQILPDCNIVGPISSKEAEEYLKYHIPDLIASTSKYTGNIPSVTVNPLLLEKDVESINNKLMQLNYTKQCHYFIEAFTKNESSKEVIYLKDCIEIGDMAVLERCTDWKSAIHTAAKPLLEKNYIEQRYVDKIIQVIMELGSYMVLMPEIAFVHAGVDDGINRNCSSMLVIREPIYFGSKNPKRVRILIVLGIKERNNDSFLKIIKILENNIDLINSNLDNMSIWDLGELCDRT